MSAFTVEADLRVGNGDAHPADGFSISFVRANDPVLRALQAGDTFPEMNGLISPNGGQFSDNGSAGDLSLMEEGTQTGLSIGFDLWDSGNYTIPPASPAVGRVAPGLTQDYIALDIRVDGLLLAMLQMPNGTTQNGSTIPGSGTDPTSIETGPYDGTGCDSNLLWVHLKVVLDTYGELSVYWKNSEILSNFQTGWYPSPGRLLMGARVGGSTANIEVDNLQITTVPAANQATPSFPVAESTVPALRSVEVHFYEGVTGVTAGDLLINSVPATNVTAYAPWQYVFDFPEPPLGSVQVSWATNVAIQSLLGRTNVSLGAGWRYTLDRLGATAQPGDFRIHGRQQDDPADEFGDSSDWIEIYNGTGNAVNLSGLVPKRRGHEPDTMGIPELCAGERRLPGGVRFGQEPDGVTNQLHTNFKLPAAGSFLALVDPRDQPGVLLCPGLSTPADGYFLRRATRSCSTPSATTPRRRRAHPTPRSGPGSLPSPCFPRRAGHSSIRSC